MPPYCLAALAFLVSWCVMRSPFGLALRAIREDEDAAADLGVPPFLCKLAIHALAAFLTGMAGGAFARYTAYIHPDGVFAFATSMFTFTIRDRSAPGIPRLRISPRAIGKFTYHAQERESPHHEKIHARERASSRTKIGEQEDRPDPRNGRASLIDERDRHAEDRSNGEERRGAPYSEPPVKIHGAGPPHSIHYRHGEDKSLLDIFHF